MMIKSIEEVTIYKSPEGETSVYARRTDMDPRALNRSDNIYQHEEKLAARWVKLKDAVFLDDPTINNLLNQIEVIMELKK